MKERPLNDPDSESDIESDCEVENDRGGSQEHSNSRRRFTVWLLHVGDEYDELHYLVLGRLAVEEEFFERTGKVYHYRCIKQKSLTYIPQ